MDRRRKAVPGAVYQDKQLVVSASPTGLRFVGAIDASNVAEVSRILASALDGQSATDVHLDLYELEFSDVSGIRAIVAAAEKARDHHRLILHGLPPLMRRVMDVVGWTELPTLFVAGSEPGHDGQDQIETA